ncbi:MAG: hypothetical protein KatS3mg050_0072 [Litorilinea sp.]|nr:MAG: hypothetical protein KatS3mg050_0072 [Litorilinea sp.]
MRPTALARHPGFWALILALLIWLPRGLVLDRFVTADEHAWLTRSGNFYQALVRHDWANTFQRHHPGVTVTWAGALGFLMRYPAYAQDAPGQFGWLTEEIEPFLREQGHDPVALLAAGRSVAVLLITAVLLVAFGVTVRLLGLGPALLGFGLIALDPFHVAHSRLLHLDGLVSSFMLLAVVAFIHHLLNGDLRSLLLSAVATSLAWLTRSPALFLAPLAGLFTALHLVQSGVNTTAEIPGAPWARSFRRKPLANFGRDLRIWPGPMALSSRVLRRWAWRLLLWGGVAAGLFVLLWPAMWVHPVESVRQILEAAETYAAEGHLKPTFFAGQVYGGDPGFFFYPITYLWRSTPPVLVGLLLAAVAFLWRGAPFGERTARVTAVYLALYAGLFMLFMNVGAKKFDRYVLPSYLPLDLLAGAGWYALAVWLGRHWPRSRSRVAAMVGVVVLGLQAGFTLPTAPYYLSYYNPLLGGSRRAPEVMMIGWGEGADQAARYLNSLPNARELVVASGYTNGPFSYFFQGRTLPIYFWHQADYAVLYAQDFQRQLPSRAFITTFSRQTPVHVVRINGLDYAYIYDLHNMPLPDYVTDWADAIRLVTYQLPAGTISPGDTFRAIFYLVNRAPIPTNWNVLVRVVGADGVEVARSEGWPWGAPTSTWREGDVWPDGHDLTIPPGTPPGIYRVELGFYDPADQTLLPATGAQDGTPRGDLVALDYIQVGTVAPPRSARLATPVELGGEVRLIGARWLDSRGAAFDPARTEVAAGEPLTLQLYWQAAARPSLPYTVFVHVVDGNGHMVAQDDHQPLQGFFPTDRWFPGVVVADTYRLQLPGAGAVTVFVGMYDGATGQRLPVQGPTGTGGDSVQLTVLSAKGLQQ